MRTALSIAGSDPTGGAGIQADLQVFRAHGVHGAAVITTLTIQDSHKVHASLPVFPNALLDQLRTLLRDIQPHAVKIGALATDDLVRNTTLGLMELAGDVPIVLDPVLAASDGTPLLERRAWPSLEALVARSALVTPNLAEAALLSGHDASSRAGAERGARAFVEDLGASAALVKGGHREGAPDDLLAIRDDGGGVALEWLEGERVAGAAVHGTGCALSAAVAAELALGAPLRDAVLRARAFVLRGLRSAEALGGGARFLGLP